ncbi:MAG: 23S rRNA (pseudouridine(1915)-N(3))-methyltransferase RlmH [Betaproteobacteria bacterium]|nr:23S rRNA (pseudouridine(1915)-N(3))-methyltransferase RlmH [Betaproteobacteria bacterium]
MRVSIVSVGHKMPAWIQSGYREYVKRLPPEIKVELSELKPEDRSGKTVEKARMLEGERILAAIPGGATVYALDEKGRSVTTQGLSVMLAGWMRDATHPLFVIGGADGLPEAVRSRADKLISLSALTLPHGLVRVVLAEQLYRAWSILANHPYHRE